MNKIYESDDQKYSLARSETFSDWSIGAENSVESFFDDDKGHSLLPRAKSTRQRRSSDAPKTNYPSKTLALTRSPTIMSIDSVILPTTGFLTLSLDELCDVISQHRSLQAAEIVCTEGYAIRIGAVMHRLLILQLRRPGKRMVWLRLDRLRSTKVSNFSFLLAGGSTPANDRAQLATEKEPLIAGARLETHQTFTSLPTLGDLSRMFRVISAELRTYELWPANCWFFVSLLQEHLGSTAEGTFLRGDLPYPSLAQEIRRRIREKLGALSEHLGNSSLNQGRQQQKEIQELVMFLRNSSDSKPTAFLKLYVDQLSTYQTYEPPEAQDAILELARAAQAQGPLIATDNADLVRLILNNLRVAAENGLDPTQSSIAPLWLSYGRALKADGYQEDSARILEEALRYIRASSSWPVLSDVDRQFVTSLIDELVPLLSDSQLNQRAIDLQRDLVVLRKQSHQRARSESSVRGLIQSLNQLGDLLLVAGQPKAAREARMEALELHHDIDGPVTFLSTLRAHASWLLKAGFDDEAYQTAQEAYRKQGPLEVIPQYKPYLADGQFVLARFLVKANRLEEAFSIWETTISAHREHRAFSSGPPTPDITTQMREYRDALLAASRFPAACSVDEEIVANVRKLYAQRPTLYTNNLAKSLWNYAESLTKAGRLEQARDALEETVQLYRGLFLADRSMYSPVIAPVLCEYACVQHELSLSPSESQLASTDLSEAVTSTVKEAIRITRWVLWAKGSTTSRLLSSLDRLADVLIRREEWEIAQDVTNEIRRLLPHPSTTAEAEEDEKPVVTLERVHELDKMCKERVML